MLLTKLKDDNIENMPGCKSSGSFSHNIPLELQVLISASRIFLGTEEPSHLKALVQQGVDWKKMLGLANEHGVMPLLYRAVSQNCPRAVPEDWMARLRMQYMMNAARNMKMTAELLRILEILEKSDIKAVPLKGPVLAQKLYGDVALRQFVDLDVLVAREDAEKALEVLTEKGYGGLDGLSGRKREALYKNIHHYALINRNKGINVELHWGISPTHFRHTINVDSILERAETVTMMGKDVPNISNEDLLLLLCQHGTKHVWQRLSWINDVAKLASKKNLNWPYAHQIAIQAKNERPFIMGLLLAKKIMHVSIPQDILESTKDIAELMKLSDEIVKLIIIEENDDVHDRALKGQLLNRNMFDNPIDRAKFIFGLATTPTNDESIALSLPDNLFIIYNFTKPVRVMISYRNALWNYMIRFRKGE
jgi:hypothetical protein